jgi:parallel beta-helix repeat protein
VESEIESSSRICPVTPKSKMGLNQVLRPRTIFIAVSLAFILTTAGLAYYWMQPPPYIPPPPPPPGTPHGAIAIDGDDDFLKTALLEGWPGDGSPENPYIIHGLEIDLGGEIGNCISISNTRVSFTISNCNLTGAAYQMMEGGGAGICIYNVTNGELVNNTCFSNAWGISLDESHSNTVTYNSCYNNAIGISLGRSKTNTVANNTCNSNGNGIRLYRSDDNTVTNNTCNSNEVEGINIEYSSSNIITNNTLNGCGFFFRGDLTQCRQLEVTGNSVNTLPLVFLQDQVGNVVSSPAGQVILVGCSQVTVKDQILMNCSVGVLLCYTNLTTLVNNICNRNDLGIYLYQSSYNTVENNICNRNDLGIYLYQSSYNTVENNTCNRNDLGIYLDDTGFTAVENNTCNNNRIGIYLIHSNSDTLANNTCLGNTEHDIFDALNPEDYNLVLL